MSSLGTQPRYYREEFERRRWRLPRWAFVGLLVLLATVSHYAAFLGGAAMQAANCRLALAAATGARPACAGIFAPVHRVVPKWACSAAAHHEYHNACRDLPASEISAVPPKEHSK